MNVKNILFELINYGRIYKRLKKDYRLNYIPLNVNMLTKENIKEIKKIWGGKFVKDFRFYTQATGKYSPYYIPDNVFSAYMYTHFNNCLKAEFLDDKNYYDFFMGDIQRPLTILRKMHGYFFDKNLESINLKEAINLCKSHKSVIIKQSNHSSGGNGIYFWDDNQSDDELTKILNNKTDFVIEKILIQHKELSKLNPTSVNTVRIMTFFYKGRCRVLSSVVRMGINSSKVDNASQGGITCGILEDGRLKNRAFDTSGNIFYSHPTNNQKFEDIVIPNFDKAKQLVLKLHNRFLEMGLISWDIAFDELGQPNIIEVNLDDGELDFHQLNNGPIFGDLSKEIIDLKLHKKHFCKMFK